jgi:hypothetical protein
MLRESEACGLVLSAPLGRLPQENRWVEGRLYGPALFPQMVSAVEQVRASQLLVIAGCGVSSLAEGELLLDLGVAAVQFDVMLWS